LKVEPNGGPQIEWGSTYRILSNTQEVRV